jgi:hypothetical protein
MKRTSSAAALLDEAKQYPNDRWRNMAPLVTWSDTTDESFISATALSDSGEDTEPYDGIDIWDTQSPVFMFTPFVRSSTDGAIIWARNNNPYNYLTAFLYHLYLDSFDEIMKTLECPNYYVKRGLFAFSYSHYSVFEKTPDCCCMSLVLIRKDLTEADKRSLLLQMHLMGARSPTELQKGHKHKRSNLNLFFFRTHDGYELPEPRRLLAVAISATAVQNHLHHVFANFKQDQLRSERYADWTEQISAAMAIGPDDWYALPFCCSFHLHYTFAYVFVGRKMMR